MSATESQIKKRERDISLAKEKKEKKEILPEGSAIYEEKSININMVRLPSLSLSDLVICPPPRHCWVLMN